MESLSLNVRTELVVGVQLKDSFSTVLLSGHVSRTTLTSREPMKPMTGLPNAEACFVSLRWKATPSLPPGYQVLSSLRKTKSVPLSSFRLRALSETTVKSQPDDANAGAATTTAEPATAVVNTPARSSRPNRERSFIGIPPWK